MEQGSSAAEGEEINVVTVKCVADCMGHTCGRSCIGPNRMLVRFPYAFLFLLTLLIAWIVRDYGSVALSQLPRKSIFSSSIVILSIIGIVFIITISHLLHLAPFPSP